MRQKVVTDLPAQPVVFNVQEPRQLRHGPRGMGLHALHHHVKHSVTLALEFVLEILIVQPAVRCGAAHVRCRLNMRVAHERCQQLHLLGIQIFCHGVPFSHFPLRLNKSLVY